MPHAQLEPKPTGAMVEKRVAHLGEVWEDTHTKWKLVDTFIQRTFQVWPDEFKERSNYHPARPTAILDNAVDNQLSITPKFTRPPHKADSDTSKSNGDLIENWLDAVFEEAALLEPSLTWKQAGRHLLGYGYTVIQGPLLQMGDKPTKPRKQPSEQEEDFAARESLYENEKRTWMPYRMRAPHPARVLLDPMEKRPSIGILHAHRFATEINDLLFTMKQRKGVETGEFDFQEDNPFEQIMISEVFTRNWHGMFKGHELIFVARNRVGRVPFHHAFSGFGQEMTDEPDGINPVHLAVGVLDKAMESLQIQAQASSAVHNALIDAAFRQEATSGNAANLAAQRSAADGDTTVEVPGGPKSIWYLDTPDLPQWIFQAMTELDADIEMGTLSKQLSGIRETGVTTVGQQAILNSAAGRKFIAPTRQLEHLATNVAVDCLRMLDMLKERITVRGHSLSPSHLEHDYSVEVSFELQDPVLAMQERVTSLNEFLNGLMSKEDYWARVKFEDATGAHRRIAEDAVRADPLVAALTRLQIMNEWGLVTDAQLESGQTNIMTQLAIEAQEGTALLQNPQPLTESVPGQPRIGANTAGANLDRPL